MWCSTYHWKWHDMYYPSRIVLRAENDVVGKNLEDEPLVTNWEVLREMIKYPFYLIGYEEDQYISTKNIFWLAILS
jgi:hypothetical protein